MEGGERRGPETSRTGTHRNLNIGTESRVQIANALGKELHHSIMSKLWDSEAGPIDRHIKVNIVNIQIMGWIYGEASYNKGKFNSHFLYRNVVITLYSEDVNDIEFESNIFDAIKVCGVIYIRSEILVDASKMSGKNLNTKSFSCNTD